MNLMGFRGEFDGISWCFHGDFDGISRDSIAILMGFHGCFHGF